MFFIRKIINYEKRLFYAETSFGDITDFWCLDFSRAGRYDVIYNHILTHKYFLNQKKEDEVRYSASEEKNGFLKSVRNKLSGR